MKLIPSMLLGLTPVLLFAFAEGPDAGVAGVPREASCTSCHRSTGAGGSVEVKFPGAQIWAPGVKQHLTVTIADSAQKRWGFQMAARLASNSTTQAGTFTPGSDGYTQIVCAQSNFLAENFGSCPANMPLQYIEHTKDGTRNGTRGGVSFEFDWTPPADASGDIVLYVAANAADGDGSERGDHIYTRSYQLSRAVQQPSIRSAGVDAGATIDSAIAAGSWLTIKGVALANSTQVSGAADIVGGRLLQQLGGVSVAVNGAPAFVYSVSPEQVNAIAPADAGSGTSTVQVNNNGALSAPASVTLQPAAPVPFLWAAKYAVATRVDYSLVGPASLYPGQTTPAKPGEVVILWCAGLGDTNPTVAPGTLAPASPVAYLAADAQVTIGGIPATVYGAALAPGMAGLYQVAVAVPAGLADGDQPVRIQVRGISSPSGIYLTIHQ